jgi:hypothetical protein
MAAGYTKIMMPLGQVKEKEVLSRLMGCKGVGFSFVRFTSPDRAPAMCTGIGCRKRFLLP